MDAKRILFVVIDLHGGAGVFCRILANALRKKFPGDFHLSLLVLRRRGFLPGDEQIFDRIVSLDARIDQGIWRVMQVLGMAHRLKAAIEDLSSDCAICVGSLPDLLVPILSPKTRTILTVHSNYTHLLSEASLAWVLKPMLMWRFGRQVVVAPSRGVANDLTQNFNAVDVRVIHHGMDADQINEFGAAPVSDLPDEPYILAVGRLSREKDYPTMLRAYARARMQSLAMPLVIVGEGPEKNALQTLAEQMGIADHVYLLGHRENPFAYMRGAEFLALSSMWEGFGLVLIEAMSLGVPCVASDCPSGPGEILGGGEYGMLVPVGDVERLAEAMLRMHEPETRSRFAELARKRSVDFSLARMANAYRKLLDECAIVRP